MSIPYPTHGEPIAPTNVIAFPNPPIAIIEDMEAARRLEGELCADILRLASRRHRDRKRIARKQQRLDLLRKLMESIDG